MSFLWFLAINHYTFLSLYLKYLPGNIFVNNMAGSCADILGNIAAGYQVQSFGFRKTLAFNAALMAIAGILMMVCAEN